MHLLFFKRIVVIGFEYLTEKFQTVSFVIVIRISIVIGFVIVSWIIIMVILFNAIIIVVVVIGLYVY